MRQIPVILLGVVLILHCFHLTAQEASQADRLPSFNPASAPKSADSMLQELIANNTVPENTHPVRTHSLSSLDYPYHDQAFHPYGNRNLTLATPILPYQKPISLGIETDKKEFFLNNRRNRYSSLWGFASLNYIYADLVGLMDKNILAQYQKGEVNGAKITPGFLAAAAGFMQIPLSNVFLPQIIKNEKTLRWVQIASGSIMTLVQAGTLFVGKPSPNYIVFSAFEIGTTLYITLDAIKWKPKKNKNLSE